jgi:Acyl-ACP thioesterase C-terminal domain
MPRLSDLDINGHVNNAQLLGWTLEALPREVSGKQALREIDIFATSAGWMTRSHRAPKRRTPASSTTASSGSMMAANSCARAPSGVRDSQSARTTLPFADKRAAMPVAGLPLLAALAPPSTALPWWTRTSSPSIPGGAPAPISSASPA